MKRLLRWTPALLLLSVALAAFLPGPVDPVVIPAVFRWKNNHWLEDGEELAVTRNGIQRVYHKLLDIDWNPANGAHPVSIVRVPYQWRSYSGEDNYWAGKVELVPCIYITNQTFLKISDAEVDELAHNLLRKLRMDEWENPWKEQLRDKKSQAAYRDIEECRSYADFVKRFR